MKQILTALTLGGDSCAVYVEGGPVINTWSKVSEIRKIHVQYLGGVEGGERGGSQVSDIGQLLMFSSSLLSAVSDFN
jgi:hypothetical protein